MRIAIVGAGAIGSVIAGFLLDRGQHEVSLVARGAHLAAIKANGLTVLTGGRELKSRPAASDNPADLGLQDLVIVTVKAHGLPTLAPRLSSLFDPDTRVVCAQNGIPWWYFHGAAGPDADMPFPAVDPDGVIWRSIGPERAIGCVINIPASINRPGVADHGGRLTLHLGAPRAGEHGKALGDIADMLESAGVTIKRPGDIRQAVWTKLLRNIALGPTSVLTGAPSGDLHTAPGMAAMLGRAMRECLAVARAWGVNIDDTIDEELAAAAPAPTHKTSMLQDYEAGRLLELDSIVAAVIDLAAKRGVAVPQIETLLALVRLKVAIRDMA